MNLDELLRSAGTVLDEQTGEPRPRHDTGSAPRPSDNAWMWAAAAIALAVVGAIAVLLLMGDRRADQVSRSDGPTPNTMVVSGGGAGTLTGIRLQARYPASLSVGTETWIQVSVINEGEIPIFWQAGGCAIPAAITVNAGATDSPVTVRFDAQEPTWDGRPETLRGQLDDVAAPVWGVMPADARHRIDWGCTADSNMLPIEPGEQVDYTGYVDLRMPPIGDLAPGGKVVTVDVEFVGYLSPEDYPSAPQRTFVKGSAQLVDDPHRSVPDLDALIDSVNRDGRLAARIAEIDRPTDDGQPQLHTPKLWWWDGMWELWVTPKWGWDSTGPLRLRIDPTTYAVVDARLVIGGVPDDAPRDGHPYGFDDDVILPSLNPG